MTQLQSRSDPMIVDIVLALRQVSSETIDEFMRLLQARIVQTKHDGKAHDFSASIGKGWGGVTFVCAEAPERMEQVLSVLIEKNKYVSKSDTWIGIGISSDGKIRMVTYIDEKWRKNANTQKLVDDVRANNRKLAQPNKDKPIYLSKKRKKNLKKMKKKSQKGNRR